MSMMAATVLLAGAVGNDVRHFCEVERVEKRAGGVSILFSPSVPNAFVIDIAAEKKRIFKGREYRPPVRRIYVPEGARAMVEQFGSRQCILAARFQDGKLGVEVHDFITGTVPGKDIGSSEFVLAK